MNRSRPTTHCGAPSPVLFLRVCRESIGAWSGLPHESAAPSVTSGVSSLGASFSSRRFLSPPRTLAMSSLEPTSAGSKSSDRLPSFANNSNHCPVVRRGHRSCCRRGTWSTTRHCPRIICPSRWWKAGAAKSATSSSPMGAVGSSDTR